jgi:hypothetical protein
MAENKVPFTQFIGPSNTLRSARFDAERTVNYYLEINPVQGSGKNQMPAVLLGTPGLTLQWAVTGGQIRGMYTTSNQITYIVAGNTVYRTSALTQQPVSIGLLNTSTGYVSIADNGIQVVFVDKQFGYYTTIADNYPTITEITSVNFYPSNTVTYQDGYFIFSQTDTQTLFISDLYSVNFLPLNTTAKTGYSDDIVGLISNNRQLYIFGEATLEVWYDEGSSGSTPFVRQDGRNSMVGCISAPTIQKLFNTLVWVGTNAEGAAIVYMLEGDQPTRISNHAVELSLQSVTDFTSSTAYTWQHEGHYFYVLNVPGLNTTWMYDLSTQLWTELQTNIGGVEGRHLANRHVVMNNVHLVGDYTTGNIYKFDFTNYTDNGVPITRIRQSPHLSNNLYRTFYKMIEIDFSPGTGLTVGTGNAVAPSVTLQVSTDGGLTFGQPRQAMIGKRGNYYSRARWGVLGSGRDLVFKLTMADPVKFDLLAAFIDFEQGNS